MFYNFISPYGILKVINSTTNNLNIGTLFGNPTQRISGTIIINEGILVKSTTTANAGMYGTLPDGSLLKIINMGVIHGMGGGGAESNTAWSGSNVTGASAGHAIKLPCETIIINYGYIFGGGGGGGTFDLTNHGAGGDNWYNKKGGGGGAGGGARGHGNEAQSYDVRYGYAGTTGQTGAGGNGSDNDSDGRGGAYGQAGFAPGGSAGKAVDKDGQTLLQLGEWTSIYIKGLIS